MTTTRRVGAVMALALGLVTACGSEDTAIKASDTSVAGDVACPNGKVRFGVEPYEAPEKLTPAYKILATALEKGLGCPVELTIVSDYTAEVLAMKNGKLDIAQFGPLGFVFASKKANAEPIASFGDAAGELSTYKAAIWVPKDSAVKELADLKGKSLALAEPGSTSGDALPRYALEKIGIKQADLDIEYAGGHPEALLALIKGKVDAAEINTQQLATAKAEGVFDEGKFRQVWTSDPIPNDPITVWGDLDPAFKAKVAEVLTGLSPADVAAVGKFLDVDPAGPMIRVDKETYQPLFDLAEVLGLTEKDV